MDALSGVRRTFPTVRLLVVGREGYGRRLVERLQTEDGVSYSPHVPQQELVPLLRAAAVLVQPSMNENFGSAVAEALSCGTPVVVGPTNGTAAYISKMSAVFSDYSADAVAAAVVDVIRTRRASPQRVVRDARRTALEFFDPSRVARHLASIIDSVARDEGR
jgi:glycosyltransferase involved in cell wall biosynthesis